VRFSGYGFIDFDDDDLQRVLRIFFL